jgi:saccharopine dehydrogenase (NAD+, L-lysine-forming)
LLYGANGYTGRLIARRAVERGHRPVLAGRSPEVREIAAALGLESRVFDLASPDLRGVAAVLNAAGPFARTAVPLVEACERAGVHYLDITGEIEVFEALHSRRPGIAVVPGVGFDVVPTDCLAAMLKDRLPGATHLELSFRSTGASSRGTTRAALEAARKGCRARIEGRIATVPWERRGGYLSIPWGDVSTAYHSTGIPNVRVWMAAPRWLPLARFLPLWVARFVSGPDAVRRSRSGAEIRGVVTDARGFRVEGSLSTPDGYDFTADAAVRAMEKELRPGAWTPSRAFGSGFVLECDGVRLGPFTAIGADRLAPAAP